MSEPQDIFAKYMGELDDIITNYEQYVGPWLNASGRSRSMRSFDKSSPTRVDEMAGTANTIQVTEQ